MSGAVIVGALVAAGTYLILQRGLVRITVGFALLGHAANVLLLLAGNIGRRAAPIVGESGPAATEVATADPLPQAFVLTAIVITFGMTAFLLALAYRSGRAFGDDDIEHEEDGPR